MTSSGHGNTLSFSVAGSQQTVSVTPQQLVIAGYTARDQTAVQAHIDELAHIGVAPPPSVPMFYPVPVGLATCDPTICVRGTETSGEVEPVLIRSGGGFYLAVGSDHTDREVEKRDIGESKASAPKPVSATIIPLDRAIAAWDQIAISCWIDGDLYQQGLLAAMLQPEALLGKLAESGGRLADGALMFCGTLPLLEGAFVFGKHYELALSLPDGTSLEHAYDVTISRS